MFTAFCMIVKDLKSFFWEQFSIKNFLKHFLQKMRLKLVMSVSQKKSHWILQSGHFEYYCIFQIRYIIEKIQLIYSKFLLKKTLNI